ncbi:MAG: phosphohistidine phosphatase SixA [Deltaproteobacteria bacterium RIFCSPLOWO2_12_FULL_40_28]|nr:MAG: phosphohistidine phosphatase SixA [Deltaproteobacteria bacterium RIFCSPHIGHO2_02_FULL_40_28]OGQ19047.1 MAG: phosphohistidine phosphatase SixA [Deltaproteobacteria bacterium RIFCSPHIGHO2_12_FULL_40_32]OGQ40219.1 MAG: phosphohistidine phosphatase SixA [Deltaproteobacteria bacterium RIFCSPLOWO2_02_FULL_40_36]OGQ53490.1 MAG: phosphohistidine phosphatase SixA [Deltaproteobacteria bacterium RIFCSPLOWO2_12_FULL_40_28]
MKIYLMRHGHAETNAPSDNLRKLSLRGIDEVKLMSQWLTGHLSAKLTILASPLARTFETAKIVHQKIGSKLITTDTLKPEANPQDILTLLEKEKGDVLLISHMPLVSLLASCFIWGEPQDRLHFKTAGLCEIEISEVGFGKGKLLFLIQPTCIPWEKETVQPKNP